MLGIENSMPSIARAKADIARPMLRFAGAKADTDGARCGFRRWPRRSERRKRPSQRGGVELAVNAAA
ncbi:hypothetical protein BE20_11460 [Sorangium cellulosum]|uniref:Uncharacterized protein n=1 Tax=Sorangium cellulosum TaxID=56 RepID=A0A150T2W4_SORCE|nr:hypothetical protein BE20_11460 [Sorangium cellulosum]KYF99082.1 hypothetical protein BE18_16195 [Sorangium cellulosum]